MMENTMKNSWLRGPCIGRGAYGTVNAGVNISNAHIFAVKSVDLATAPPSHAEALENEITILKSLASPFIVKYLGDDKTTEGSPATCFRNLHMEYLPAGTAADLANPDEAVVASYAWCLVSALSYLHSRGIVHCDVKGKNVLLGPSPGSARLADFGSASAGGTGGRGSPLWMAPEVIRGEHQGPESDVWSVGCTVIEMVTGKPAWGAEAGSVCRIGYSDELPLFPAGLSSLCVDFLEKCLRRDYTRRWSCDQLLQHPLISMRSHEELDKYSSPRCVLDCLNLDFDEEDEEEAVSDDEMMNLEGDERIRGLVSGEGANWESDGWLLVRTCSEYSHLIQDSNSNSDVVSFNFNNCDDSSSNAAPPPPPLQQENRRSCASFATTILHEGLHLQARQGVRDHHPEFGVSTVGSHKKIANRGGTWRWNFQEYGGYPSHDAPN
ncbi:hypothetical protein C2S52_017001 [Perilla frutescens var. hirtella]|nr:hypothetical protein C2S52_017001 [Perilla frutescens var. hirtella]